jgi:hypothetical protein
MRVVVIFEFDEISNPDSEEATAKVDAITEACETMQVAFDASGCWISDVIGDDTEKADFALVAEYEERQHAMELEDFDNFGGLRDNTDPITKATNNAEK